MDRATACRWTQQAVAKLQRLHDWVPKEPAAATLREHLGHGVFTGRAQLLDEIDRVRDANDEAIVPRSILDFRDDTGALNVESDQYPDGLYLLITYQADAPWTLDLWFVDQPNRQPDVRHVAEFRPRLDDELRGRILTIKSQLRADPVLGRSFSSFAVYQAVLDDGVADLDEFLLRMRRPGRTIAD